MYLGNHEVLKGEQCRWGKIDPDSTLTYKCQCSLIEGLRRHYLDENHPDLGVCYRDAVQDRANVFVSFAYGDNFIELVGALMEFLDSHPKDFPRDTTFFWFDLFVNDQWNALDKKFEWWATTFREAVQQIGTTVCFLSPWKAPSLLTRVWCLCKFLFS